MYNVHSANWLIHIVFQSAYLSMLHGNKQFFVCSLFTHQKMSISWQSSVCWGLRNKSIWSGRWKHVVWHTGTHINRKQCHSQEFFGRMSHANTPHDAWKSSHLVHCHSNSLHVAECGTNIDGQWYQQSWCESHYRNAISKRAETIHSSTTTNVVSSMEIWNLYFMNYSNNSSIMFIRFILYFIK